MALDAISRKTFVQGRGLAMAGLIIGYSVIALSVLYVVFLGIVAIADGMKH
jgi:hypothetical protein